MTIELHGSGDFSSRSTRAIVGVCFVFFLTFGLGSIAYLWLIDDFEFDLAPINWSTLMSGKVVEQIDNKLGQSAFPKLMARLERGTSWVLFGSLGPRVRQGCPGWLFLADEFAIHKDRTINAEKRLRTVVLIQQMLAHQNVDVLLMVVPDKSRVQRAQLCGLYRPPSLELRLDQWVSKLKTQGVNAVSAASALESIVEGSPDQQPFLRTDTHWSQAGALAAATVAAAHIRKVAVDITPHQTYSVSYASSERYPGDLVRLAGIDWLPLALQPKPDWVKPMSFTLENSAAPLALSKAINAVMADDNDLFGEVGLPTLALLGTSFSRTSYFVPSLENLLQTRIINLSKDGGDFWGAASYYFDSPSFKETPPKMIIWEIPERVIEMPVTDEEAEWSQKLIP